MTAARRTIAVEANPERIAPLAAAPDVDRAVMPASRVFVENPAHLNLRFPLRERWRPEARGAKPACHASGRLDDRRGNGVAVDIRATAPNWLTFSDERDKEPVHRVRRNECAGGADPGYRRNWRCCELSALQEIAADHRSHTSSRMSIRARRCGQNAGHGGVAGASPAEGGAPAILAPTRGKAFPRYKQPKLDALGSK